MKQVKFKGWVICFAVVSSLIGLTGCVSSNSEDTATVAPATATDNTKPVILTFFTNNSDRSVGQGKVEQKLIDEYTKLHPDIQIKVETLSPDTQFQDKIKIYNATDALPDIINAWGNPNYLTPLVNNHALAEINTQELADGDYLPSALDAFKVNGKLYGIPKNTDFWVMYYNKKMFDENGLTIPKTETELMAIVKRFKDKNIIPIAMAGRDPWPTGIWFDTMVARASGTWETSGKAIQRTGSFKDPAVMTAARTMQKWVKAGTFGEGFLNQDYSAARNLFGQGKAAMFMMGEWEMGMAADPNFLESVRDNIGAFPIPSIENGKGSPSQLAAWFGGGYAISEKSTHKKEALEFLKWAFRPEGWAKAVWQDGITFPAQRYQQFLTGNEKLLQKDLTEILSNATELSGKLNQDKLTTNTQKIFYDSVQKLVSFQMTPEELANVLDKVAENSNKTNLTP
jgi:raffinose/stachyose/melibiose transport system substrate-binding protein